MAVIRFGHLGICVADLDAALRFWRDLLGFRALSRTDVRGELADKLLRLQGVDQTTVFVERDGVRLALFAFRSPKAVGGEVRPMNARGMAAIMLRVDDLEATVADIRRAAIPGVRILDETRTDYPAYRSKLVFLTDPDGTLVELVEIPGDPYAPFGEAV